MQAVLNAIRKALIDDENIVTEGARARFVNFNSSSLDIEIFAYFQTYDFATSLEMREALMLRLIAAVGEAGTSIAFPTQTLLLRPEGNA